MDKLKKLIEKFSLKGDIIITLMGITLLISLAFIFKDPMNKTAILAACIAGGLMNALQGMKYMKDAKKKTTGMSLIMTGIILIVVGFIIITARQRSFQ